MQHNGTKYEHTSTPLPIDQRTKLNHCPICNDWFRRKPLTPEEIIATAYKTQPHLRFAINPDRNVIGSWDAAQGRYVCVAGLTLTDIWVSMEYELLVNGVRQSDGWDWTPILPNGASVQDLDYDFQRRKTQAVADGSVLVQG